MASAVHHSTTDNESISINPYTGEVVGRYVRLKAHDIEPILSSARSAFLKWRAAGIAARSDAFLKVAGVLTDRCESLAHSIALEMGKPMTTARAEITKSAGLCRWYAERLEALIADEVVDVGEEGRATVSYLPIGVVLGIMPWNFPIWQVLRAAIPIMSSGNTFLLKHADNVQGCARALTEVMVEAGLTEGIFQNLNVHHSLIPKLLADSRVAAVTVTAGVAAGSAIAAEAGRQLKKSVLELGGSDAFIVLADANLDKAVPAAIHARFQNSGQVCIAAKRIIVERSIAPEFTRRFVAQAEELRCGDPLAPETQLGPLARRRNRDELHDQVERSISMGAKRLLGGVMPAGAGSFYPPTVLADVTRDMPVFKEETFGPVAAIIVAEDAADALALANDSKYGLCGALWTDDIGRAERLATRLEAGGVFINGIAASDPRVPIGGIKRSGYGRELSYFGIREFCNTQLRWTRPGS